MGDPAGMELVLKACDRAGLEGQYYQAITLLLEDGGIDTQELTHKDVAAGLLNNDAARWDELIFSMGEMSAHYGTYAESDWTPQRTIALIIALTVLKNGSRHRKHANLDMNLRGYLKAIATGWWTFDYDSVVDLLRFVVTGDAG